MAAVVAVAVTTVASDAGGYGSERGALKGKTAMKTYGRGSRERKSVGVVKAPIWWKRFFDGTSE